MTARNRHMLSASVFVALCREREVLLLRRRGTGWMDGCFSLPAGGLEQRETLADAAVREVAEEIGVRVAVPDLVHAHVVHALTEGRDWFGHVFTTQRWDGVPRLMEPSKHADLGWWPLDGLPPETIPYVRQALGHAGAGLSYSHYGWPMAAQLK